MLKLTEILFSENFVKQSWCQCSTAQTGKEDEKDDQPQIKSTPLIRFKSSRQFPNGLEEGDFSEEKIDFILKKQSCKAKVYTSNMRPRADNVPFLVGFTYLEALQYLTMGNDSHAEKKTNLKTDYNYNT